MGRTVTDQPSLLEFSWGAARGAGHMVLDTPDLAAIAPAWVRDRHPGTADGILARSWWTFHVQHPEVAIELDRLARRLLRKGHTRFGIAMLWETLRCESMLGAGPDDPGPRLNNNHRAYYARFLMEQNVDLVGVFELRTSEAEKPCTT